MAGLRGWWPGELAAPKLWPKRNSDKLTWKQYFPMLEDRSKAIYKHAAYVYVICK